MRRRIAQAVSSAWPIARRGLGSGCVLLIAGACAAPLALAQQATPTPGNPPPPGQTSSGLPQEPATGPGGAESPNAIDTGAPDRYLGIPGYTPPAELPPRQFVLVPAVTTMFTATTNAPLVAGHHTDDVITLSPSLTTSYTSARFTVNGYFAFDGVAYLHNTEPDRVLPHGTLNLNADLYDKFLLLDAGLSSTQSSANIFRGQDLGNSTDNLVSTTQSRLSPYILREVAPDLLLLARSDNVYTHSTVQADSGQNTNGYLGNQTFKLESRALPIGWSTELGYSESEFEDQPQPALRDSSARASVDYSIGGDALLGLIGGYESVDILDTHLTHSIAGVFGDWRPSPLTDLNVRAERRYFGTGWNLRLTNRGPLDAISIAWQRTPTTYQEALASAPSGGNLVGLLNQVFLNQFTDPGQRSLASQSVLEASGFPQSLPGAQSAFSELPQLVDSVYLTGTLLGKFDSLAATLYRTRTTDLLPGEAAVATSLDQLIGNNVQYGGTLSLSHSLAPETTLVGSLTRATATGLGAGSDQHTLQTALVLRLTERFSKRTTAFVGLRRQVIDSTLAPTVTESAVFVGLTESF